MSEEQDHLAELLRTVATDAERHTPRFDVDQIVAVAHRRRPWLALGAWLRSSPFPAPAFAVAALVIVAAVGGVLYATLSSNGGRSQSAVGSTTTTLSGTTGSTTTTVSTTTIPGSTTTTRPPVSTTSVPVTTTVPPVTSTVASTTTSTTTTTVVTSTTSTTVPYTYLAMWNGSPVQLQPIRNVDIENFHAAKLQGMVTDFYTDDPAYASLVGDSLDVFSVPGQFQGQLVVNNSEQSDQPNKGTWTFAG